MTKREFFENELKMKPSEIGTAVPFNPNGETEVTEAWLISFIKNLLAERTNWHTEKPTKDDWYFVLWRDTDDDWRRFSALLWNNHNKTWYDDVTPDCNWGDEYHAEVIAWMPIPDFKENDI